MDPKVKEAIFRQVGKEPFAQKFGLRLIDLDEGYSRVEMTFSPDMENIHGMAHGGALFALIDEAFETASNSHGTTGPILDTRPNGGTTRATWSRIREAAMVFSSPSFAARPLPLRTRISGRNRLPRGAHSSSISLTPPFPTSRAVTSHTGRKCRGER